MDDKLSPVWDTVNVDEVAEEFDILPFTVRRMMKEIEVERREELEIKIKTRMHNASQFLRVVHDRAVEKAVCKKCGHVGFDTWDEMQAHVRCHLMLDNLDDPKFAGTAQRVAADCDKLFYPQYKMSLRQKRQGILPPDEDETELAERVVERLGS